MAYEFHYTPTGTGAISGTEVLEQTEDAINDLGNTAISGVQAALDKAEQAFTNSANAVDDAQTALNTANNAEGVAIQAQNDVSNLSGTVTNIGNRVTTAEGNIGNLQGRMTTAEGNIGNLQGRMTTAEGNIGNLQTAVSTAQATANSAQQTATTARQQSYVFRYSSTALVASSTNSNALLDNTDNLKVGDKVIDSSGVLFSITAIDTANSTFTIGTALIDLAQDSDVVHKSGDETVGGVKTFSDIPIFATFDGMRFRCTHNSSAYVTFRNVNQANPGSIIFSANDGNVSTSFHLVDKTLIPYTNVDIDLGTSLRKWKSLNGINPGALSLPDLANGIDISSYIDVNQTSEYTASLNGYISICGSASGTNAIVIKDKNYDFAVSTRSMLVSSNQLSYITIPVLANHTYEIICGSVTTIDYAKFYPCQGNV